MDRRSLRSFRSNPRRNTIEVLECRIAPAFTGSFSGPAGNLTLSINGSLSNDQAIISLADPNTLALANSGGSTLSFDLTGVTQIFVQGFAGDDSITLDLNGGAIDTPTRNFQFIGGGGSGFGDSFKITGTGSESAIAVLQTGAAGSVNIAGSIYTYSQADDGLYLSSFASASVETIAGADDFTFTGSLLFSGSRRVWFASIPNVSVNLGVHDTVANVDSISVLLSPGTVANNSFSVSLGDGNDEIDLSFSAGFVTFPSLSLNGGLGVDSFTVTHDGNITLSNVAAALTQGVVNLNSSFETANLVGGAGANTFDLSGWSGSGSIEGNSGADTIIVSNDVSIFGLNATTLSRTGMGVMNFAGIEAIQLTGGPGTNTFSVAWTGSVTVNGGGGTDALNANGGFSTVAISPGLITRSGVADLTFANIENVALNGGTGDTSFNVSNWSGQLTISGGNGFDTVVATNDVAYLTISDTRLERAGSANITLAGVEAATLTGGAGANSFFMSGWTGSANIVGGGGTDRLFSEENVESFTLSPTSLIRTGMGLITYSAIEDIDLIGGTSANVFAVSGSVSGASFDGRGGGDIVSVSDDAAEFVLTDSQLARTGRAAVELISIESANLTGGVGANSFTVSDWTGTGTIDGGGGTDTISATNDVAAFVLANTELARTGRGAIALSSIERVLLTGGASATSFDVSGWTGTGTLDGSLGANTILATSDAPAFVLGANQFSRTGTGTLTLSKISNAVLTGGVSGNSFNISSWFEAVTLNGLGGSDTVVAVDNVTDFTLTNTQLLRTGKAAVTLVGIEAASLTGGASDNRFNVSAWTGTGNLDGGGGSDTLLATNNVAEFVLSDTQVIRTGMGTISLAGIETANLTSTSASATFTISAWTGLGTITGLGANDSIVANNNVASFVLSNTQLARTGRGNLVLAGMENAQLAGGIDDNAFDLSGWTGAASLDGVAGNDTILATNDVANFVLSNAKLDRTGMGSIDLISIEGANLVGGSSANSFTLTGWTRAGSIDGQSGADVIILADDTNSSLLSDTQLLRNGSSPLSLVSLEVAHLTGGPSANGFNVSGWSGSGSLDGGGGSDTVLSTSDSPEYLLTDTQLARTSRGVMTLTSVEAASLTGGILRNIFNVSGWTGTGVITGGGGDDTLVAENDSAEFFLSNAQFTRTGHGTLALSTLEVALLSGGASSNQFTVSDWTGGGTLDGGGGDDAIFAINDIAQLALSDSSFARSDRGTLSLGNFEIAQLTGGVSANEFNLTGWTGIATLQAAGGGDTLVLEDDAAEFFLNEVTLARTARGNISLAGFEAAHLTGGSSANAFTLSGWTGTTSINGLGGTDAIVLANDVASFGLSDTSLVRNGMASIDLQSIEVANLTGGTGATSFDVSGWTGSGTLNGGGGNDTLIASNDVAEFVLSDIGFARTGRGSLILVSLENALLSGGAAANAFVVSAWTGTATLDGLNGIDAIVAATDVANIGLSADQLTRTGMGVIALARLENSSLTGGASENTFTVSGWGGGVTLAGLGATDVFNIGTGPTSGSAQGGDGDDLFVLGADISFQFDGNTGNDTFRLGIGDYALELPALPNSAIQGVEVVDVRGTGNNSFVLNEDEVLAISADTDTLRVRNDVGDPVVIGEGWNFGGTEIIEGISYAVFTQGSAILKVENASPYLVIGDESVIEGTNGNVTITFTIVRGGTDLSNSATVTYGTLSGTAKEGLDFTSKLGVLAFAPGQVSQTITIDIHGDDRAELNEMFSVRLFSAGGAIIARDTATGTIVNDDPAVTVSPDRKTATYVDLDGDVVTIKTSKPVLDVSDFTFKIVPGWIGGVQLEQLDLSDAGPSGDGTNLTITAKPGPLGGNGFANIGFIHALGTDLGSVKIAGDLGRIDAGDGDSAPAVKSLTLRSLGAFGLETQGAGASLESKFEGHLGKLLVQAGVRGVSIVASSIGSISILQSMIGGSIAAASTIGSIAVRGSIIGTAEDPVTISAGGQVIASGNGADLAMEALNVGGGVEHLRVMAGYDPLGEAINADASIGRINVGGDWHATTVLAGVWVGDDGFAGTADDALLSGGLVQDNPQIVASIGALSIKGQAFGTFGEGDMFGVASERIGSAKIGAHIFEFAATGSQGFYGAPSGPGAGAELPTFDFAIREIGSFITAASTAPTVQIDSTGKIASFTDVDGDWVFIKRSSGTFVVSDFELIPSHAGGGELRSFTVSPAPGDLPVSISVSTKRGDAGNGFVNIGYISAVGVDLGNVIIAGDLGRIDAGNGNPDGPAIGTLNVQSLGAAGIATQAPGGTVESHIAGGLGKLIVKSDIRGAIIESTGTIGSVSISNSLLGGGISSNADIGAVNIRGDVMGTADAPVLISAVGKAIAPSKGVDTAIRALNVAGGVEFLRVLAGYDTTGIGVNADASIGTLQIGGDWRSSTVLAGVFAGIDGREGTADDAKLTGEAVRDNTSVPTLISQIARVTIRGQVLPSAVADTTHGIIAEQIAAATIGTAKLPFAKGPHTASDYFSTTQAVDFHIGEARQ